MADDTPKTAAKDGTRRGGARPGAGRKKKQLSAPTSLSELELKALLAEPAPEEIDGIAQRHADLAIETLSRLMIYGASESAKITAAKEILDRGYGKPAVEIGGDAAMLPFMMAPQSPAALSKTDDVRSQARKYAAVAVATLRKIAQDGQSETARAGASKALLDRGLGTVGKARMPDEQRDRPLGKKEEAARAAEAAATGRFATPPPPRALADTTLQ
ncbi:hypothetical protein [Bradyrhizobium sp. SZCCHNRI1003]|uniref:hypothetical protein n=1 Tax=Bradyrhizobium sp. SZCCHNRI1003 TaxID=3057275 RepID=UPI002916841E|nr:hypothetical protein [Bradyrhizobium sp. SZCCHNRI1003]